ncbi:hypothetical protein [Bradyrhizobium sp. CCBAU 45384]|uniref:hypothetical protein n=1 Tax=Bradyrhizobium sp. CCBAU 45384 TaxID=858428 RepID=UPI00230616FC|nr:hypothetical protein [Bradyrhizobium sp. CCBAU 45384]MDA9410325.1 hypothetical protein [Bradyrhizobium sp. CCBAU 45384]
MLTDADIAMLCDIDQSIAFSYAHKNGDTYERTPKGEAAVIDRGAEQGVMSISRGAIRSRLPSADPAGPRAS